MRWSGGRSSATCAPSGRRARVDAVLLSPTAATSGAPMRLETSRLVLLSLTPEAIDALLDGDGARLATLTDARFPSPLRPPPLTEDVLPLVRERLRADPAQEGWWTWLVIRKDTKEAVGSVGFGGGPDEDGAV